MVPVDTRYKMGVTMVASASPLQENRRDAVGRDQLRPKPEWTRACLVRAARDVFTQRGFSATTLQHIGKVVGVTRPAVYHHFRSKLELFNAVLDDVDATMLTPRIDAVNARPTKAEQLRELFRPIPHYDTERRSAVAFLVTAVVDSRRRPDLRADMCTRLSRLHACVGTLLFADASSDGAAGDVDAAAIEMTLSILWGWALTRGIGS
jgi:AcrR family transcriptional regulator